jgi:nitroimidazol reductase NimA-like FMN-containing flavoprotein (pyridoxamine 5'-phosphate oxidase superfamily)
MPRERIEMDRAEILALLAGTRWVALGTLDADGAPAGHVVPCALEGERLCFAVEPGSDVQRAIERDPRVCAATDRYPTYYEIRGVTVHGRAQRVGTAPAALQGAGAIYALPLDDMVSFDFSKIQAKI